MFTSETSKTSKGEKRNQDFINAFITQNLIGFIEKLENITVNDLRKLLQESNGENNEKNIGFVRKLISIMYEEIHNNKVKDAHDNNIETFTIRGSTDSIQQPTPASTDNKYNVYYLDIGTALLCAHLAIMYINVRQVDFNKYVEAGRDIYTVSSRIYGKDIKKWTMGERHNIEGKHYELCDTIVRELKTKDTTETTEATETLTTSVLPPIKHTGHTVRNPFTTKSAWGETAQEVTKEEMNRNSSSAVPTLPSIFGRRNNKVTPAPSSAWGT